MCERKLTVFVAAGIVAIHIIGNGDETYVVLPEQHLREVASLQIVTANTAHVLDKNCGDLACFNVFHQLFPCRTVEIAARPAVISVMNAA